MDGADEQKKEEKDEGFESGEEGDCGEEQPGAGEGQQGRDRPPGWRSDPHLPAGWKVRPAGSGRDAGDAPAAGRGRPVRRRVRRGGGGAGAATTFLTILNQNVCGWNYKKASFETIVEKLDPDICTWQETGLTGTNQIRIKGYHPSLRNRKNNKTMGVYCSKE